MHPVMHELVWVDSLGHIHVGGWDTGCILLRSGRVYDIDAGRYYSGRLKANKEGNLCTK